MERDNLNTEKEFYLAKWLGGSMSDDEILEHVSKSDLLMYKKIIKGVDINNRLNTSSDKAFHEITSKIEDRKKASPKNRYWTIGIAASIVLLLGWFTFFKSSTTLIQTTFGEQKVFALLDGSEVILNSKSEISYEPNDWKDNRHLFLDGEAYFKVKKGSTFTVETKNGSIAVLGTQFNVNSNSDYFQVVCYEGKVQVQNEDENFILMPKQTVRKINGNTTEEWLSKIDRPTWVDGESTFRSVPIKYVISSLERQYNVKFDQSKIDNSTIYTGSFSHNDFEIALKTVFQTLEIKYTNSDQNIIVLSRN